MIVSFRLELVFVFSLKRLVPVNRVRLGQRAGNLSLLFAGRGQDWQILQIARPR